jgi:hypothetical protein
VRVCDEAPCPIETPNDRKETVLTLNDRELATILAALEYWKEEMCPHGHDSARPYWTRMKLGRIKPLAADEITRLSNRLRSNLRRRKKSDHGNQDS